MDSTLTKDITFKRHELRRIFARHRGAAAKLARELDLKETTISKWLHGKTDSRRIDVAAQELGRELLAQEGVKAA